MTCNFQVYREKYDVYHGKIQVSYCDLTNTIECDGKDKRCPNYRERHIKNDGQYFRSMTEKAETGIRALGIAMMTVGAGIMYQPNTTVRGIVIILVGMGVYVLGHGIKKE